MALIKVGMADYKVGRDPSVLISYGLGSCIGVSLWDPIKKLPFLQPRLGAIFFR